MKNKQFGYQLNEAVKLIAHHKHMTMTGVYADLAEALFLSPHTLNNWRYGRRSPSNDEDTEKLVHLLWQETQFNREHFNRAWFNSLLRKTGYLTIEELLDKLFPATETAPNDHASNTLAASLFSPPKPENPPNIDIFIGREKELISYRTQLQREHFLAITGMAGIGKTTIAARLIATIHRKADHIFWHTFHQGETIEDVIWKMAAFLSHVGYPASWMILQQERRPPTSILSRTILQSLKAHNTLLCIDNLHFAENQSSFSAFWETLQQFLSPSLSVIVLSRHKIRAMKSVSLPDLNFEEARNLYLAHGVQIDDEVISALYQSLQGNPQLIILAIEMIKQGWHPETLNEIWRRNTIAKYLLLEIYQQLDEDERAVMSALSILQGMAETREAVEVIADINIVLPPLVSLQDRHLILTQYSGNEHFYSLHSIVNNFFYQLLSARERESLHFRAASFFESKGNYLQAATHYEKSGKVDKAAELTIRWSRHAIARGETGIVSSIVNRLIEKHIALLNEKQITDLFLIKGVVHRKCGQYQKAFSAFEFGITQSSDLASQAQLQYEIAATYESLGAYSDAEKHYSQSLQLSQELKNSHIPASAYGGLGWCALRQGETEKAIIYFQKELDLIAPFENSRDIATTKFNMGVAFIQQKRYDQAKEMLELSRASFQKIGGRLRKAQADTNLGYIYGQLGNESKQLDLYTKALQEFSQLGDLEDQNILFYNLAEIFIKKGDHAKALDYAQSLLSSAQEIEHPVYEALARCQLAEISLIQQEIDAAQESISLAHALATQHDHALSLGYSLRIMGEISFVNADYGAAREQLERSVEILRKIHADDELNAAIASLKRVTSSI